jgi:hypothetical protein
MIGMAYQKVKAIGNGADGLAVSARGCSFLRGVRLENLAFKEYGPNFCGLTLERHVARLFLAVILLACFSAPAQEDFMKNFKFDCQFQETPQINAENVAGLVKKIDKWMVINVSYQTVSRMDKTGKQNMWMDDLSFEYEVLMPGEGNRAIYLSGTTTYWSIPLDGREHHAVAFIHPRFLQRFAPELKITPTVAKDMYIRLKVTMNQAIIGGAVNPERKAKEVIDVFKAAATNPNITRVNDSIYCMEDTPWRNLNNDYYELLKTDSRR